MQLSWKGLPTDHPSPNAFTILLAGTILYWTVYLILGQIMFWTNPNLYAEDEDAPFIDPPPFWWFLAALHDLLHYIFVVGTALLLYNVRRTVRHQSAIRQAHVFQDAVCSLCCPCLVAGQLLRHTTDYDVYPATCCTERGVPEHAVV